MNTNKTEAAEEPEVPELNTSKNSNWYGRFSIIFAIAGFMLPGTADNMDQLATRSMLAGIVGTLALICGFIGLWNSYRIRVGRWSAVLGIILGTLVAGLNFSNQLMSRITVDKNLARVQKDLTDLCTLVEQYKANGKVYPTTAQGLPALVTRPTTTPSPSSWNQLATTLPVDPWSNTYIYRCPVDGDREKFEIRSRGPDGIERTDDDISSLNLTR